MSRTNHHSIISLANILMIVGLCAVAASTYFGHSFMTKGRLVHNYENAIIAAVVTAICIFLLWLMVHAKKAHKSISNWRIVEHATLLIYIIASLCTAVVSGPLCYAMYVVNSRWARRFALNNIQRLWDEPKTLILACAMILAVHLLILFKYFTTFRSRIIDREWIEDGGSTLHPNNF